MGKYVPAKKGFFPGVKKIDAGLERSPQQRVRFIHGDALDRDAAESGAGDHQTSTTETYFFHEQSANSKLITKGAADPLQSPAFLCGPLYRLPSQNFDKTLKRFGGINTAGDGPCDEFQNIDTSSVGFCPEDPSLRLSQFPAERSLAQSRVFSHFLEKRQDLFVGCMTPCHGKLLFPFQYYDETAL